jgi:hypothetical protein
MHDQESKGSNATTLSLSKCFTPQSPPPLVLRMYNIYKHIYTNSLNNLIDDYEYLFVKS